MRYALPLCVALLLPLPALAQEDDRSYLTAFLEDNLSGAGRKVTITGFEGALSSQASIEKLEIADDQGVWITLDNVVLDWSRSALLSGEVEVNELSAEAITIKRIPASGADNSLPTPEAAPFALPDLPVSVNIGKVEAVKITLGKDVLGEPIEGRLVASLSLDNGEGKAALVLERTDGQESRISLDADYANTTGELSLDLTAQEAAGGLATRMMGLPGEPAVDLTIKGEGTLSDFTVDARLASDGQDRLSGPVTVTLGDKQETRFSARLAGDLAPLFLPQYADFLGNAVSLDVAGIHWPTGEMALEQFALRTQALQLAGTLSLAADGLPTAFDLKGTLAGAGGKPVLLPLSGDETWVQRADISLVFDAAKGSGWQGSATLTGLDTGTTKLGTARLSGSGTIAKVEGKNTVDASLNFAVEALSLADAALQKAIGAAVTGNATLSFVAGNGAVKIPRLVMNGQNYGAAGELAIEGLDTGLMTSGKITLTANDLSRFADLAGMALAGSGTVNLEGKASQLSGEFDVVIDAVTQGLRTGIAQADRLTKGESRLALSALRDATGTTLRSLDLTLAGLSVTASGTVSSKGNGLKGHVTLADLGAVQPGWGGGLSADASFTGTAEDGQIGLTGQGTNLRMGQTEVDSLLTGQTTVNATATLRTDGVFLTSARLNGSNIEATATGTAGSDLLQITGRLRDLALLVAGYSGPVTLTGQLTPTGDGAKMDLRVRGPAAIDARVAGSISSSTADLTLQGTADAAIANTIADPVTVAGGLRMDLALRGPLDLASVSGRITLSGGRVAYPLAGFSLQRTEVVADLSGGRTQLAATAEMASGGRLRLNGGIEMTAPFGSSLDLELQSLHLRDAELYDTTASGRLKITGPPMGRASLTGRVDIGETELRVPATGFASSADLEAIRHINDSAAIRGTRDRAGLGAADVAAARSAGGSGPDWALDVRVDAPNRVFLRGRGLDAELGGQVQLGGTLNAVSPSGAINLIRGRMDILGKRLDLSEASLVMEGDLVPYLTVVASNVTDEVTSYVNVIGPVNDPAVTFSSSPELPEEEVLAWLLFGHGLDSISPLQAAQLANAVAVLAGRGGMGIMDKLRKGFGVDDLDVKTADDGTTSVSAGKYISRNVYTSVGVDQDGKSQINLNLDLKKGVTVKGRVSSDGESGLGIFLERDY